LAAFFPAALRSFRGRFLALDFACRDSALDDAADVPSFLSAFIVARDRFAEVLRACPLFLESLSAFRRVLALVFAGSGGGSFTPARRAFDKPIAIACFADRAPCFPSRTCSISSRTNSPACVDGDLPSSSRALSKVSSSGIFGYPSNSDLPENSRNTHATNIARASTDKPIRRAEENPPTEIRRGSGAKEGRKIFRKYAQT
jgi:hypothetical protein